MNEKTRLILNWILGILLGISILSNAYFGVINSWMLWMGIIIAAELIFILFNLNESVGQSMGFWEVIGAKALCLVMAALGSVLFFAGWKAISPISIDWKTVGVVVLVIIAMLGYALFNQKLGNWLSRL